MTSASKLIENVIEATTDRDDDSIKEGPEQFRLSQVKTIASKLGGDVDDQGSRAVVNFKSSSDATNFVVRATALKLLANPNGSKVTVNLTTGK